MTVTPPEFRWREWKLGEGEWRGGGPESKPRPPATVFPPAGRIPQAWHLRLKLFLLKRRVLSQAVTLGPFKDHGALYRVHDGGVENVQAAWDAGVRWALLCLADPVGNWHDLGAKLDARGIPYGFWFHCHTVWDIEWLLERSAGRPIVGINVEDELDEDITPAVIADTIRRSGYQGQVATILPGWVPNSANCAPISRWPALLEVMPQDAPKLWPPYEQVHDAFEHARIQGLKAPLQLMGCQPLSALSAKRILDETGFTVTPGPAMPAWYDRMLAGTAVYTTDDVEPRWPEWAWK